MADKRFYVTIEVTAQMRKDVRKMTDSEKRDVYGSIIDYIRGENRKRNSPYSDCYVHNENILSVFDEKGNEL